MSEENDARKPGFYSDVMNQTGKKNFEQAVSLDGIDEEIALLRVKIKGLVEHDSNDIKLIMRAVDSIGRLARIKYSIGKNDKKGLLDAVGNVLKDIVLPVGMTIGNVIKKG